LWTQVAEEALEYRPQYSSISCKALSEGRMYSYSPLYGNYMHLVFILITILR